jgi:hypothetical protein
VVNLSPAFMQRVAAEAAVRRPPRPFFSNNDEGSNEVNGNRRRQAHEAVGESDLVGLAVDMRQPWGSYACELN